MTSRASLQSRSQSVASRHSKSALRHGTQSKMSKLAATKSNITQEEVVDIQEEDEPEPEYELPGVLTIPIKPKTQKQLQIIVGDDVTSEKPWKAVKKSALLDHIANVEESDFIPIKEQIKKYPEDEILLGYLVNEQSNVDEFYVCSTVQVKNQVSQLHKERLEKLRKTLTDKYIKYPHGWATSGSEQDIDEMQEDQRFRSLFEVEIESKFPVISEETKFRNRNADDIRDGFVEITPYRETFNNAVKVRIHTAAQATPPKKSISVQTICTFPTNKWAQYKYEYEPPVELPIIVKKGQPKPKTPLEKFLGSEVVEPIYDELVYNSILNLYKDDYPALCDDDYFRRLVKQSRFKEFMSFADVVMCQDKFVGSCSWHHSWSGIVVLSYVDAASSGILQFQQTRDEVYRAIHGVNPVLIWSAAETLHAILELESPREARVLAFCPFDENILLGGLMNGQVIIWDLQNRIKFEEQTEYLTPAQQKYKTILKQLTSWFKNIKNDVIIRPACISNLYLSHRRAVSSVVWLPPQYRITRAGKSVPVPNPDKEPSYQFISSSEDGFIFIWDLALEPEPDQEVQSVKVSKRLQKRLEALNIDKSRYSSLNRILKPIFKLVIPKTGVAINPITALAIPTMEIKYMKVSNAKAKDIKTQQIFKPIIPKIVKPLEQLLYVGFATGEVGVATWEGYEVDAGSSVNTDTCKIKFFRRLHDGPVIDIITTRFFNDVILTLGGQTIAMWKTDYFNAPIFVQKKSKTITCGSWSLFRASCFHIGLSDGSVEVYDIINRADKETLSQSVSGKGLTVIKSHHIQLNKNILGIGDYRGTFRIFNIPHVFTEPTKDLITTVRDLFAKSIDRRKDFLDWQDEYRQRHIELLNSIALENERQKVEKKRKLEEDARLAELAEQKKIEDEKRRILFESRPQPGQYEKWAQKKFDDLQAVRMHNILLKKKQLKRDDLVVYLAPLNRIEEEKRKKAIKQEKMLTKKNKMFDDALAISFPETLDVEETVETVIKIDDIPIEEPEIHTVLNLYNDCEQNALSLIESKSYDVQISWSAILLKGVERKHTIDIALKLNMQHRKRFKNQPNKPLASIEEIPEKQEIIKSASDDETVDTLLAPAEQSVSNVSFEDDTND